MTKNNNNKFKGKVYYGHKVGRKAKEKRQIKTMRYMERYKK